MEADRDASGKPLAETERTVDPGVPGRDIRLTIDAGLQLALEQEVMSALIANGAKSVSAVVMDPWTGEIYAEATYPSYDANGYAAIARRRSVACSSTRSSPTSTSPDPCSR